MKNIEDLSESQNESSKQDKDGKAQTQPQLLLELCADVELFHTPDGESYATMTVNGHVEHWPLRSKGFRGWLGKIYFEKKKSAPSAQSFLDAIATLEGRAQFDGTETEVFLRIARLNDKIYIDLGDPEWRVV